MDRQTTPWLIVTGHRPGLVDSSFGEGGGFFSNGDGNTEASGADYSDVGVALDIQNVLWPLFVTQGVDLVLGGHNHAYQRHCAFRGGGWNASRRETYFGDEGCSSFSEKDGDNVSVYKTPNAPVSLVVGTAGGGFTKHDRGAGFTEVVTYRFGYLSLSATSETELRGVFYVTGDADEKGDEFRIERRQNLNKPEPEHGSADHGLGTSLGLTPRRAGASAATS